MAGEQETQYDFRRLDESQLPAMQRLLFRAFGREIPLEEIRAKYATEAFGEQFIGFLAYAEDGFPAAYYGVFPIQFTVGGQIVLAAQSGDTMTDPDHQKRGLFIQTAKKTYELAQERGIQFVFGFPNQYSYPGFKKKLEWKFYGNMQDFSLNVLALPLAGMAWRWPAIGKWYSKRTRKILSRNTITPEQAEKVFGSKRDGVLKNVDFYHYKSFSGATPIRVNGFSLYVKVHGQLVVGDVAEFPEEEMAKFVRMLKQLARRLGCHKCMLSLSENHWLRHRLSDTFEQREGLPIGIRDFESGINFSELVFSRADYDTF